MRVYFDVLGPNEEQLASSAVELCESGQAQFRTLYDDDMGLWDKARTVARSIYGADDLEADQKVRDQYRRLQEKGHGKVPVCMAKTPYSFSTDPQLKGAPSGHVVPIREIRLAGGAGFLVVLCGDLLTMPGLPRVPAANNISVTEAGEIEGLF